MLNDNAKKWVAALRSGEYEQGEGYLCLNGKHCCLGVASVLYAEENPEFETRTLCDTEKGTITKFGDCFATCPALVQKALGLRSHIGAWDYGSLTGMNDTGKTFSEIADLIESEPEGLFV